MPCSIGLWALLKVVIAQLQSQGSWILSFIIETVIKTLKYHYKVEKFVQKILYEYDDISIYTNVVAFLSKKYIQQIQGKCMPVQ